MKNPDEQRLLKDSSLDELIKLKMEEELENQIKQANTLVQKCLVTQIEKVPKNKILSKEAVFKCFNKKQKTEFFINGMQADAFIGAQNNIRNKLLNAEINAFSTDDLFVKFAQIEI